MILRLSIFLFAATGVRAQPAPVTPPAPVRAPAAAGGGPAATPGPIGTGAAPAYRVVDPDAWLTEKLAAVAIRERVFDPFLRRKDPSKAPPEPTQPQEDVVPEVVEPPVVEQFDPKAVFLKAVEAVKLSMPGKQELVNQAPTLNEGDTIFLSIEGKRFRTKILSVTPTAISVQDVENGTKADIKLNVLPGGMGIGPRPSSPASGMTPRPASNSGQSIPEIKP